MNTRLTATEARTMIRACLQAGNVTFRSHAVDQMFKRKLTAAQVEAVLRAGSVTGPEWENGEWRHRVSAGLVAVLTAYWALAARRAFGVSRLGATLKSLVMLLAFTPTIIAYRFVVFLVTLYTT